MPHALLAWLESKEQAMLELLREIVNIDSGSYDKAGVDRVVDVIRTHLESSGVRCEIIKHTEFGNSMRAVVEGPGEQQPIMLLGHCDTVFPSGTAARRSFKIEGQTGYGPGIADMKAGLVVNTFVLEGYALFGGADVFALYTSDEEIASPVGRDVIEREAQSARAVLNAEPGRPSGNVVTSRKGAAFINFEVAGRAAHSGVNHGAGASAIEALCRKVPRLHRLTNYAEGTTVNVGLVRGGTSVNTVADSAAASIDIRFRTIEAMNSVLHRVQGILEAADVPGTSTRITSQRRFLPMVPTPGSDELFRVYKAAAERIGFDVDGEFTGGSADSGFTAALGVPTLCGVGPVGGNPHTAEEYLDLRTIVPRAKALALTVRDFGR